VVHGGEDRHGGKEVFVLVTLTLRSLLNNIVEGRAVEFKEHTIGLGGYSSGTRSVVQKCKLAENAARIQSDQVLLRAVNSLVNIKLACLDDVEHVTLIAFLDNGVVSSELLLGHSVDANLKVLI